MDCAANWDHFNHFWLLPYYYTIIPRKAKKSSNFSLREIEWNRTRAKYNKGVGNKVSEPKESYLMRVWHRVIQYLLNRQFTISYSTIQISCFGLFGKFHDVHIRSFLFEDLDNGGLRISLKFIWSGSNFRGRPCRGQKDIDFHSHSVLNIWCKCVWYIIKTCEQQFLCLLLVAFLLVRLWALSVLHCILINFMLS